MLFSQVSGVLEMLMADVCQPFYYHPLGLEFASSKKKILRVLFRMNEQYTCADSIVFNG